MAQGPRAGLNNPLYQVLRAQRHSFDATAIRALLARVSQANVDQLSGSLMTYITTNLPNAFEAREGLAEFRSNPYVLMTAASVMRLTDPMRLADFLFNSKLYMSLETSFGKSIESVLVGPYPVTQELKWTDPPEKITEFALLEGLTREARAQQRMGSVWREIDKHVVVGNRRYLVSIKSGPNTINDTQVQAMTEALIRNYRAWANISRQNYPGIEGLDIVVGLTYGTDKTTNNKDNQILAKMLNNGFEEEDRTQKPGVLIDTETHSIRLYRRIGKDFWAFVGDPTSPFAAEHTFLEILLALIKALGVGMEAANLEERINVRMRALGGALAALTFPPNSFPAWIRDELTADQEFLFATAMTSFFDDGI